jgi:hypothetical protein
MAHVFFAEDIVEGAPRAGNGAVAKAKVRTESSRIKVRREEHVSIAPGSVFFISLS